MKNKQSNERGQILILLALLFIGIIAFAALTIDGGMVFSNRRASQNAADSASMSGATKAGEYLNNYLSPSGNPVLYGDFSCSGAYIGPAANLAKDGAITSASQNNFTIYKDDSSAESRVEVSCVDNGTENPPYNKYIDVKVWITTETTSSLAHLFYSGKLKGTVEAYTRLYPGYNAGLGSGILATCNNVKDITKEGIIFSGTAGGELEGSGAFSNCSLISNGGGTINAPGGSINYYTTYSGPLENYNPDPQPVDYQYVAPASAAIVSASDCGGYTSAGKNYSLHTDKVETIGPGSYDSITQTKGALILSKGLYCIKSKAGFTTNGGVIIGDGVTIFMMNGGISIAGNDKPYIDKSGKVYNTSLMAPYKPEDRDLRWYGYLIVMDDGNSPDNNPLKYSVDITGTSQTQFAGTIFAPNHNVKMTGTSDTSTPVTFSTQVIGNTVTLSGTPLIKIVFDASHAPYFEPSLDLHR